MVLVCDGVCGYGLWITYGLRVVLTLRVDRGALQGTRTVGKHPLGALMGASCLWLCGRASIPHTHKSGGCGCGFVWFQPPGLSPLVAAVFQATGLN